MTWTCWWRIPRSTPLCSVREYFIVVVLPALFCLEPASPPSPPHKASYWLASSCCRLPLCCASACASALPSRLRARCVPREAHSSEGSLLTHTLSGPHSLRHRVRQPRPTIRRTPPSPRNPLPRPSRLLLPQLPPGRQLPPLATAPRRASAKSRPRPREPHASRNARSWRRRSGYSISFASISYDIAQIKTLLTCIHPWRPNKSPQ